MPGVATRPIGSGSPPTAVSHASPPAASLTSFGAFSWYFDGSQLSQMSFGSRMWQSASTIVCFDMRPPVASRAGRNVTCVSAYSGALEATQSLLDGVVVVDLGDEPAARAARVLGDLGATVLRIVPPDGGALDGWRAGAWAYRSTVSSLGVGDPAFDQALGYADIVFDTPGARDVHHIDPSRAPQAVWVSITPFGATGPRAGWRASDLGVMAASGNMYCTGDADRAPVRCTDPTAYAHTGPEAAFAALTALWTGRPQFVDVSMQEVVLVANMVGVGRFATTGFRGTRRGANIGRTREIWPTADGFVSFGLRGGKARVPSLELLSKLVGDEAMLARDWNDFNPNTATDEELRAIEAPVAEYFARHTMRELYTIACETNMMLAPANTPPEIYASEQLQARGFFDADSSPHGFAS